MNRILTLLIVLALSPAVHAADVPASALVSWSNPTKAVDGSALTGPQELTELRVYASTSAIPDNVAAQPVATLPGDATTYKYSTTAPNGATLYFRVRACNVGGCSALSAQASKQINVAVPSAPTGVAVTVTVIVAVQP